MLFKVEYVDTNMVYLNEVLKRFVREAVKSRVYRKAVLFPPEFIAAHDDARTKFKVNFKSVFDQIKLLDVTQRKRLIRMYINHQRTDRLCQGKIFVVDFVGYP